LIIAELDRTDRLDLIGFWGRRLRRLLPAVMVLLVVVVVTLRSIAEPGEWIVARQDAPWAQFYAANWHQIALGNGYWDAFAAPSAFEHLWSLAIEEQFYLVWPVVVWAGLAMETTCRRRGDHRVALRRLVGGHDRALRRWRPHTRLHGNGHPRLLVVGRSHGRAPRRS